ncbi:unnamed protein product, partial [Didymodactylos carnosus]
SIDGMAEVLIKCSTEEQYAQWMAAFRLASKGKTIADLSYTTEKDSILTLLNMQRPANISSSTSSQVKSSQQQKQFDIQPENYVATKFLKKLKAKQ